MMHAQAHIVLGVDLAIKYYPVRLVFCASGQGMNSWSCMWLLHIGWVED